MSDSTWLAVIIPSHCGERWISASLGSIVAQDTRGIEVILIDDGIAATTREIAQGFSARLRLRIFHRPDLSTWQKKTNFGVQTAESTHVCWLGVDDLWLPGRAAAVKAWIAARPATLLHMAASAIVDVGGRRLGVWHCPLAPEIELASAQVTERLLIQNFVAAPAPVFRRDAWLDCGGLDESLWYTADWDMWLKLAALAPVCYHGAITVGLRIHGASLTMAGRRDAAEFARQMQLVLDRHLAKLGDAKEIERAARASIAVNTALASASAGDVSGIIPAVSQVLRLGPAGIRRYLRDSRIAERVIPRVRAKMRGRF